MSVLCTVSLLVWWLAQTIHGCTLLLISAPRLEVYYFLLLTVCVSVCLSVCHKHCFFFFVSRWNRALSWPLVLHDKNYKTLLFGFWLRPPNAQNLLPKIMHKIAYNSACTADRLEMFAHTRGFSTMANSMESCKMLWGRPLLPWQRNFARRGDPVAYRLIYNSWL